MLIISNTIAFPMLTKLERWLEMEELINKSRGLQFDDDDLALAGLFIQTRDIFFRARAMELIKYKLTPMDSIVLAYIDYLKERATPA